MKKLALLISFTTIIIGLLTILLTLFSCDKKTEPTNDCNCDVDPTKTIILDGRKYIIVEGSDGHEYIKFRTNIADDNYTHSGSCLKCSNPENTK